VNIKLKPATFFLSAALPVAAGLLGCDREKGIRAYNAPKTEAPAVDSAGATAGRSSEPAGSAAGMGFPADLRWTLPAGWMQVPLPATRSPMSPVIANIQIAPDSQLLLTISRMPAGQSVYENVKRWAGQLKMQPPSQDNLDGVVSRIDATGAPADIIDLKNTQAGQEMLGAIVPHDSDTWIFKLAGPAGAVTEQKSRFNDFVRSIRFDSSSPAPAVSGTNPPLAPASAAASENGATAGGQQGIAGAQWTLPADWTAQASASPFGLLTIHAGNGNVQIKVSKFASLGGGAGLNVTRWRGEVGLEPVDDAHADPGQKTDMGGRTWTLHDYTGPANGGTREIVASTVSPQGTWFFKMFGPTDAVAAQKAQFDKFLAGIRFAG